MSDHGHSNAPKKSSGGGGELISFGPASTITAITLGVVLAVFGIVG